ncbi:MAG: formimidoylglutamate deiminase [Deltaproteobacteria bacterium]|nr:MAG: formimidoylglutamate deiminase [Deltaproteobacteria bacterium]
MTLLPVRAALVDGRWIPRVTLHLRDGHIENHSATPHDTSPVADLAIPALHNAHSHAFQWAMRGDTHLLHPDRPHDDFWSWREAMYHHALHLTPDRVHDIALDLYRTLRQQGWCSVAEFHYLHHEDPDRPGQGWTFASALARAARRAGIHLTLVPVAYHRAGAGRPATGAQRRFAFPSVASFLACADQLHQQLRPLGARVAIGAHSVRAVPADWLRPIAQWAHTQDTPLHIHVAEQRRELQECHDEHGRSPIALLRDHGFLSPRTVLVHATHLSDDDLDIIARSGATVCVCPSTERDLGDGLVRARDLLHRDVPLCVGTDSHTHVDALGELALLELHERLRLERRNALTHPERGLLRPAQTLLNAGIVHGARAVGLPHASLEPGSPADLLLLDAPAAHTDPARALDRLLFAARSGRIRETLVAGRATGD